MGFFGLGKSEEQKRMEAEDKQRINSVILVNMESVPFDYTVVGPSMYSWAYDFDYNTARSKAVEGLKRSAYECGADMVIACKLSQSMAFGHFAGTFQDKAEMAYLVDISGVAIKRN
ncbi:MAG: hypothetical protein SOV56_01640 [Phascolarctobacterium sp.]|nr:hypothetical protein [Phascolarctobacterium sp.]